MACYHPLTAYRTRGGDVTFRAGQGVGLSFSLPCGRCIGCRLERSRQWAMRCMYESQLHQDNCFITLTYSDEFLPCDGGLRKSDFQKFIKRLRRKFPVGSVRFFHCGEYGDRLSRPHYHAILFGVDFFDKEVFRQGSNPVFTSASLCSLWPYGFSTLGAVTFESCAYVARYVMKKVTGDMARAHYERVCIETGEIISIQPEYITMSLKPAIGRRWYERFSGDVYPSDFLIVNGMRVRPPKYFDKLFGISDSVHLERIKLKRVRFASRFKADATPERLAVREQVTNARLLLLKRHLEI